MHIVIDTNQWCESSWLVSLWLCTYYSGYYNRTGLLGTHEYGEFGAISVTERNCAFCLRRMF